MDCADKPFVSMFLIHLLLQLFLAVSLIIVVQYQY